MKCVQIKVWSSRWFSSRLMKLLHRVQRVEAVSCFVHSDRCRVVFLNQRAKKRGHFRNNAEKKMAKKSVFRGTQRKGAAAMAFKRRWNLRGSGTVSGPQLLFTPRESDPGQHRVSLPPHDSQSNVCGRSATALVPHLFQNQSCFCAKYTHTFHQNMLTRKTSTAV